jgi:outer membrane biosynthesis protein TonB
MTQQYHTTSLGWVFSILLHTGIGVLLFYSYFVPKQPTTQFIEINLGSIPGGDGSLPKFVLPAKSSSDVSSEERSTEMNNPTELPKRTYFPLNEDVIHLPTTKKSVSADPSTPLTLSSKPLPKIDEQRSNNFTSSSTGKKEGAVGSYNSTTNGNAVVPGRGGDGKGGFGSGDGIGDNVSFGFQWSNGGNRKLVSGDMPVYPSGVDVAAQIKLRVVVSSDGSVRSATPAQKGDTRLENAAISKVKLWKFESLLNAQSQIEQVCTITFNFTLK